MELKDRIKRIRKDLDLTQQNFASKIGTTQNVLANYELGRRNPSSSVINNICKTFQISEEWLRTGKGEMFSQESTDDLSELIKKYDLSDADCVLLEKFIKLKPSSRKIITDFLAETARTINDLDLFADIPDTPEELEEKYPPVEIGDNKVG